MPSENGGTSAKKDENCKLCGEQMCAEERGQLRAENERLRALVRSARRDVFREVLEFVEKEIKKDQAHADA